MSFYDKDSLHSRGSIKLIEQCLERGLLDDPEEVRCVYEGGLLARNYALCTGRELIYVQSKPRPLTQRVYFSHLTRISLEHGDHGSPNLVLWEGNQPLVLDIPGKEAHRLASFVNDQIRRETAPATDPVEEIKRYKELFDLGAITAQEYERKKRELLNL